MSVNLHGMMIAFVNAVANDLILHFFEAFPNNPSTYIRGQGVTLEEAETQAWNQLQKSLQCPGHEFERRHWTNGAGACKHCDLFQGHVFPPSTKCVICDKPTNYSTSMDRKHYCEEHTGCIPLDQRHPWQMAEEDFVTDITESDIEQVITSLYKTLQGKKDEFE